MKANGEKKLDVRVQKTYDKLYKTFFDLLATRPYDSITVLEICNETGVHRATFYKHFIDKQDFVNFCINKKLDELNIRKKEEDFSEVGTRTYYISMCEEIITFIYENKAIISDFTVKPSSGAFLDALEKAMSDYIEKRLTFVVTSGCQISSPIPLLSHYYSGALVSLFKTWAENWDKYSKNDILRFISLRYNELDFSYRNNKCFENA